MTTSPYTGLPCLAELEVRTGTAAYLAGTDPADLPPITSVYVCTKPRPCPDHPDDSPIARATLLPARPPRTAGPTITTHS